MNASTVHFVTLKAAFHVTDVGVSGESVSLNTGFYQIHLLLHALLSMTSINICWQSLKKLSIFDNFYYPAASLNHFFLKMADPTSFPTTKKRMPAFHWYWWKCSNYAVCDVMMDGK